MLTSRDYSPPKAPRARPRRLTWLVILLSTLLTGAVAAIVVLAAGRGRSQTVRVLGTAGTTRGLDVLPFPGTPDAAPSARIIFPALVRSEIKSVKITGSHSGRHAGRVRALPGGRGTEFVPSVPLSGGEHVSVQARLSSPAAGTGSGAPNRRVLNFSYTTARTSDLSIASTTNGSPPKPSKPLPTQSFRSQPGLKPPTVTVSRDPRPASGDVFVGALNSPQQGPMIFNSKGQLVWFRPITNKHHGALDVRVQRYRGKRVLTWWEGRIVTGHGAEGTDYILNQRYQPVATLHAANGYSSDLHEFQLTRQGTALITAYAAVKADLSSVGGPKDGSVLDSVVQEIDVRTGRLLWEWHSLGHIPISASKAGKPTPGTAYDYFHINSIQQLRNGNLLISARNTWGVYEVSRTTGKVIWTLGGKDSSFAMGKGTNFYWQHDARLHKDGTLTVFDDGGNPKKESQSRALELKLDLGSMRASLKRAYTHNPPVLAYAEGNMQVLRDGSVFVGWGTAPYFSEYTASGKEIWRGSFTEPVESYRSYHLRWRGRPATPPAIAVSAGDGGTVTAYASWNGATGVARWQLLAGSSPTTLAPVRTVSNSGFETTIHAKGSQRYFAVRALSASGRVLATSNVAKR